MLKKICRLLVLGMVVYAGSACVTPTHASSAPEVLISHVYPSTPDGATHEMIALFNNTPDPVDITGWCLVNKDSKNIACLRVPGTQYFIEPNSYVVFASAAFASLSPDSNSIDVTFNPLNKSSGSLVGSSDTVQLKDSAGNIIDSWVWQAALTKGQGFVRSGYDEQEFRYGAGSVMGIGLIEQVAGGGLREEVVDIPGVDYVTPLDKLIITELLPNPIGVDVGNEFIEIFNQSEDELTLEGVAIQVVGGASSKIYPLSGIVLPGEYRVFTDTDLHYSLNNTAGSVYLLYSPAGSADDYERIDGVSYDKPTDGSSYAWFGDIDGWLYTPTPTPAQINTRGVSAEMLMVVPAVIQKPCNPDQERNPETGRCRKIPAPTIPAPCKDGQYRSVETGRCRNIAASATPAPCKEGQERNSETNRCRNIKKMTVATNSVLPEESEVESGIQWYAWVLVGAIIIGVAGYGIWEWRFEINTYWKKLMERAGR